MESRLRYALIRGRKAAPIKTKVRALRSNLDQASVLDQMFYEKYRANMRSLLHEARDKRTNSFREAFPVDRGEPGIRGVRARLREFRNMVTLLAAQSALGDITTSLVSEVELRVGVQRGQDLAPSYKCPDLLSANYLQFYYWLPRTKRPDSARTPLVANSSSPPRAINATAPVMLAAQTPTITAKVTPFDTTLTPLRTQHPATSGKLEKRNQLR